MKGINLGCIPAILLLGITACAGGGNVTSDDNAISFDDFKEVDLSSRAEVITDNPDILGIVTNVKVVNDSIIAITLHSSAEQVILYNLKSGEKQAVVRRGEGPDEMLSVSSLSVLSGDTLWMSGMMDRKVMTACWNPAGSKALTELRFTGEEDLLRGVADGKGGVIGLPARGDSVRLLVLDSNGNRTDSLGVFPAAAMPEGAMPNNFLFQADIAYCPENGRLAVSNRSWNEIEIYSLPTREPVVITIPIDGKIEIVGQDRGMGVSYNPSPFWLISSGVSAMPDSFAVGYIGVMVKNDEDFMRHIGSLLEFDWEGKPKRRFMLGEEAVAFDFDSKNGYLYTIENRPEATLVRYKL